VLIDLRISGDIIAEPIRDAADVIAAMALIFIYSAKQSVHVSSKWSYIRSHDSSEMDDS
jgi:hypothetical protein